MSTAIEWTDETWNPLIGCSKVGPGCDHCYAIGVVHRGMSPQHVGLTVKPEGAPVDWTGEIRTVPHRLGQPLRWTRPRRIFVNSLSDLFHPDVPEQFILDVWATMARCPQHTFQILTKRPQRMASIVGRICWDIPIGCLATPYLDPCEGGGEQPLPNVWLGTSIELDTYTWRADHLRRTPAAVRFISAEPLLGPLPSLDLTDIDWLIVGGESGPGARPMHPDWVRDLRDRSRMPNRPVDGGLTHVAFLFKQWGAWHPWQGLGGLVGGVKLDGTGWWTDDAPGAQCRPGDEIVQRVGKKQAGRELDGRTWDEFPAQRKTNSGATAYLPGEGNTALTTPRSS